MSYNFQPTGALSCDFGSTETTTLESYTPTTTTTSTTTADNSWYIFVGPDDFMIYDSYDAYGSVYIDIEGQAHKFSNLCNPDFVASDGYNCELIASGGFCSDKAMVMVFFATENANGIWETALQCPQCGCGDDGAANLNDLYAEDGDRTVANRRPRKNN